MNYIVCFRKKGCGNCDFYAFEADSKKHAFMKFQNKILCAGRNINQYKVISIFEINEFSISTNASSISVTSSSAGYVYSDAGYVYR